MTVVLMPRMQTSHAYEFMGSILRVSHLSHTTRTRHEREGQEGCECDDVHDAAFL